MNLSKKLNLLGNSFRLKIIKIKEQLKLSEKTEKLLMKENSFLKSEH